MSSQFERADLYSLQLFAAVIEFGSIADAARRNFIAPTAVTKRVQKLEEDFNVQLLRRGSKGVVPTPAGEALARHVRAISSLGERMRLELADYAAGTKGHVRMFANPSALVEHLADDVLRFMQLHPGIRVDLVEALSPAVVQAVRDGETDLGIFCAPVALPPDVAVQPYREDRLVAVVPAGHELSGAPRISMEELIRYPMISATRGSSLATLLSQASIAEGQITFRVASNEVARWLVAKGLGLTVLPEGLVTPYIDSLDIAAVPISDNFARRQLMLCWRTDADLSTSAAAMRDFLAASDGPREP